jgi:hypothetical protein
MTTTSSSLLKTLLHKTIAEGLFKEVVSRTSKYYYFLGKTLSWPEEEAPPFPTDSYKYELDTRNEIITLKQINPSDVALVVPRIDWESSAVYDIFDDSYSTQVQGLDIINGGADFTLVPTVVIGLPDLLNGTQATATVDIVGGQIVGHTMTEKGSGYTNPPTVTLVGGGQGYGAVIVGNIAKSANEYQKLEDSKFYVVTDEYNVYKCLDNNNNAPSTNRPIGTQILPITLADGYTWKFMYSVPIALRQKFLTDDQMPVVTALTQQFYSAGGIESVIIENLGTGYTAANLIISGDGYLESDPVFLSTPSITTGGTGYADGNTLVVAPPFETQSNWNSTVLVYQGVRLLYNNNIYEVVQAGTTSSVGPTHKSGIAQNGSAALKYLGSTAKAYPTIVSGVITAINLIGGVREVNMLSFGSGYNSNPQVTFSKQSKTITSVNTTTDIITIGSHWYKTGEELVYSNGGGTSIGNLVSGTTYYVIRSSSTTIQLASSLSNALSGTRIDLSSAGTGSSHILYQNINLAVGFAELSPTGVVKRIRITDSGDGYITEPTVVIGNIWSATTVVTLGTQYNAGGRLYTVSQAGTTGSTAPTGSVLGTAYTDGTATLTYVGTAATGTSVLRYGAGYDTNPRITVTTTTGSNFSASFTSLKSEARLIPLLDNGQIISVQIDDAGIGYSSATIDVQGNGTGAVVTPDISIGNINTLQANNELLTVPGTINNIQIISRGYNYGVAPITIQGDGTGAMAEATITGGAITRIRITNQGSGYTYANVIIGGNGKAATARAVISPYNGHAKDSYQELFARTLMFYSNVSKDKNQGFDVNNDYRQLGIIKNPRGFGVTTRYPLTLGSGCYVVGGTINTTNFIKDQLITTPRVVDGITFQRRYRIVTVTTSGALIQALDNTAPQISDVMSNANNQFFIITAVNPPTIDKYSGDLLFIDNKAGFTPSKDETVTLRTVIRF